jgi:hypothetical protein
MLSTRPGSEASLASPTFTVAAIHQPQYLPYLGFFHKVRQADVLIVLDTVEYHRRGIQNRNKIKTSQGVRWLTVPVLQRTGQLVWEVETNPSVDWRSQHWNALYLNYGRALHFKEYGEALREVLLAATSTNLSRINVAVLTWLLQTLGIDTPMILASDLAVADGQPSQRLANLCQAVGAQSYLSGPGGRRYMDLEVFDRAGVEVLWQQFETPVYEQLWPKFGFIADLSIVDALFCWGPGARDWLAS